MAAGEAAAAICIDFYGRYEAQRTRDAAIQAGLQGADAKGRIGYVSPPGETVIDPDPIGLLNGAPDPELARRFVEFVLSEDGPAEFLERDFIVGHHSKRHYVGFSA